jgi:preprotein translocase subunit SecD
MAALLLAGCAERPEGLTITQAGSRPRILQVGLVLDSPAADAIQMAFPQKERGGRNTNEVLTVRLVPGLDETNLEEEQRICAFGLALEVEVQFKGKARQQLADFTRTNIGKDVALIIDGKVFWTMKIAGEASDGWLVVPGNWRLTEAQAFCKRLNATASSRRQP